ncbi:serine endopeptidase [Moraxella sp. K127]|uniref:serine endopeptidase n=1 Tax=Moraxella sp. K127 TaxID=2780079 RepID=UPI00187E215F|nr:serine endopeptidase [Moraxella sp. K127]MBE9591485.1 serine endopeptidase [Moraxella sp. K127]
MSEQNVNKKGKAKFKPTPKAKTAGRQPKKWFNVFLWIVAMIFAGFLIGLGSKIVADLPMISTDFVELSDFVADRPAYDRLKDELTQAEQKEQDITHEWEQKSHELTQKQTENINARETFENWLATRSVTEQSDQNPEVIKRTSELDELKAQEQALQGELSAIEKRQLDRRQTVENIENQIMLMEADAMDGYNRHNNRTELQVFIYRLMITLPLLLLAGYLFKRYRHTNAWPFVWGFAFFALFVFFVELVPYLPNYGGYVRYGVGIIVTVVIGKYAIGAMNAYLERKRVEEALSSNERQQHMDYDEAHIKIGKGICPSCERSLDFNNTDLDFCPHCGIHLFEYCPNCTTRKSTFNHYCFKCGLASRAERSDEQVFTPVINPDTPPTQA